MQVEVIAPHEIGTAEWARWTEIQAGAGALLDSPFLSPPFARAVGEVRKRTRVAVLSEGSVIHGFFPFERSSRTRAVPIAAGLSDVQGLVVPESSTVDFGRLLRAAGLQSFAFDHFVGAQRKHLAGLPGAVVGSVSPAVDLSGGLEAYLLQRRDASRSLIQSTARKRRKLEREHGPVRLTFDEGSHAVLEQVLAWKSRQYRLTGRRDRFADPRTRELVHRLIDRRERAFGAPLTVLRAGEVVVAAHLGLRSSTILAWWFPIYNPAFAAYSPGLVMCLDLIPAMLEHGPRVLDLGKGDEDYKARLSNRDLELVSGLVATSRATYAIRTAPTWPLEQAERMVLRSPRARSIVRSQLARAGHVRERLTQVLG